MSSRGIVAASSSHVISYLGDRAWPIRESYKELLNDGVIHRGFQSILMIDVRGWRLL